VRDRQVGWIQSGEDLPGNRCDGLREAGVQRRAVAGQLHRARPVGGTSADQAVGFQPAEQRGDVGAAQPELPLPGEVVVEGRGRSDRPAHGQNAQYDIAVAAGAGSGEDRLEQGTQGALGLRDVLPGQRGRLVLSLGCGVGHG
jgi:hypothetical protein